MVVIVLEKCPISLRGDLTKWLQEISLGVYVGQISARVRDSLWERICSEAKGGRATMVYSARNEQHLDFRVHNTSWEPIDFDGMKLMLRPSATRLKARDNKRRVSSNASQLLAAERRQRAARSLGMSEYVVVDLETTGLDPEKDEIIEIGSLKIANGNVVDEFHALIRPSFGLPEEIKNLTGITSDDFEKDGMELSDAIDSMLFFMGSLPLVMHNADFDMSFIDAALERLDIDELDNECIDTLSLARKRMPHLTSYRLEDLAQALGLPSNGMHRAINDCRVTQGLLEVLVETNE